MNKFILLLTISFSSLGFAAAPVVDGNKDENSEQYKMQSMQADEQALANDSSEPQNNLNLLNKMQSLQEEVQELRGLIEVQAHDLKLLQQQQLAFYKDIDARLKTPVEHATAPQTATDKKIETSSNNPADEQVSYLAAFELVKDKKYEDALQSMQYFVQNYPQGGYTGNALYWIGELYFVKKDYNNAKIYFEKVIREFPNSNKSAPSLLKLGFAEAETGSNNSAIARLQQVIKQYPDTSSARLASEKLNSMQNS